MIDERQEELASLHALDLLEGAERAEFEQALARDPALRRRARDLREAAARLAFTAPEVEPPAALKERVLRSAVPPKAALLFPFPVAIAWAAAACFALTAAWLGQHYLNARSANLVLRDQQALADLELRSARNELEAERIVNRRELSDARTDLADAARIAANSKLEIADLNQKIKAAGDLAQYKIAALASMLGNSPQALAVAVWCPSMQEGVLAVSRMPALPANKDYQLWVIDPQYASPVNGGVFTVDPTTGAARVTFRTGQPVNSIAKFAVSLERKGGVKKAQGPIVLLSDAL